MKNWCFGLPKVVTGPSSKASRLEGACRQQGFNTSCAFVFCASEEKLPFAKENPTMWRNTLLLEVKRLQLKNLGHTLRVYGLGVFQN